MTDAEIDARAESATVTRKLIVEGQDMFDHKRVALHCADVLSLAAECRLLRGELEASKAVHIRGCECSGDEACLFARERNTAMAEAEQLRAQVAELTQWRNERLAAEGRAASTEIKQRVGAMKIPKGNVR